MYGNAIIYLHRLSQLDKYSCTQGCLEDVNAEHRATRASLIIYSDASVRSHAPLAIIIALTLLVRLPTQMTQELLSKKELVCGVLEYLITSASPLFEAANVPFVRSALGIVNQIISLAEVFSKYCYAVSSALTSGFSP